MMNSLFFKVKETVIQWINENSQKFVFKNIVMETIENKEELLYVILNFGGCMASIIVAKPDFAPYRFVSFEAVTMEKGAHKMVYAWYDDEETTPEGIVRNLDKAINIVLEHNNSQGTESI